MRRLCFSTRRITWLLLGTVVTAWLGLQIVGREFASAPHQAAAYRIETIVTKLQSADQADVAQAKTELAKLGEDAIKPLIFLLRRLTNQALKRRGSAPTAFQPDVVFEQLERVRVNPDASSGLENVIYETLGRLRAAEAVPLLVAIVEAEEIHDMIQGMSPPMRALAEIGSAAVPALIESIDLAKTTASNFPELLGPGLTEETHQRNLAWIEGRIELRAVLILAEIGDQRAIPVLNRLETNSENPFIAEQARTVALTIKNRKDH